MRGGPKYARTHRKKFDTPLPDLLSSASQPIVQTKQAPDSECSPVRLLASYVDEFERWMQNSRRCRRSRDTDDVRQEIRVAFWELRDTPATPAEARLIFQRLASRFAQRTKRQVNRQGALVYDPEGFAERLEGGAEKTEGDAVESLALFDALEQLNDVQRWLIIECKFKERSNVDVGKELRVSGDVVRYRLWRAMTRLVAILKDKDEKTNGKKEERGAIVAPLAFAFTDDQCGVFWAIWKAEGRLPTYGGPPGPPPNPPRPFRWIPRFSSPQAAKYIASVGGGVGALSGIGALLFFLFGSPHANPEMARFGIRDHFRVEAFGNTATPLNPEPLESSPPNEKTLSVDTSTTHSSLATASTATNSSPPINPEEIRRAQRRAPRFLPTRK